MNDANRSTTYRMPAEWEPHQATWLSWPHNEETWPGLLPRVQATYAQMVAILSRSEPVHINVNDEEMEVYARALVEAAGAADTIHWHHFPTNDAWCRDHGAIFVTREAAPSLAATVWGYNAWGDKYPPYDLDAQIAHKMANALDVPTFAGEMILEGGSIEVNGAGLLLTTEACLLNPNRNPTMSRTHIEQRLCNLLGVRQVLWLGDGIAGDDTDGHVDDLARFVAPNTVVTSVEENPDDINYAPLQENLARLREMRDINGNPLEIVTLPMPAPCWYEGYRLPATYANFYIANRVILLPTFDDPHDDDARVILQNLFPDRTVIGFDCRDIIVGLGAWHCLTQQVPAVGNTT